uniref:UPAR/Ly6 domain-containing protein n=1 Tax=Anopheles funestus TaxID=62324 RepID=A0A182RB39_ANOFN
MSSPSDGVGCRSGRFLLLNKSLFSITDKAVMLIPILLMMIQFNTPTVVALRCYACGLTQTSGDVRCVTEPQSVEGQSVVTCSRKYCTITRQELVYLDEVIEDPTFITYYRSCTTDLCNSGDALGSSGSALTGLNEGASDNLLVPGLPNSGVEPLATTSPLLLIIKIASLALSAVRIVA